MDRIINGKALERSHAAVPQPVIARSDEAACEANASLFERRGNLAQQHTQHSHDYPVNPANSVKKKD
jgi:hypothetical protein